MFAKDFIKNHPKSILSQTTTIHSDMARSNSAPDIIIFRPGSERQGDGDLTNRFGEKHHRKSVRKRLYGIFMNTALAQTLQHRRSSNSSSLGLDGYETPRRNSNSGSIDMKVSVCCYIIVI